MIDVRSLPYASLCSVFVGILLAAVTSYLLHTVSAMHGLARYVYSRSVPRPV